MTDIDPIPAEFGALGEEGSKIIPPKTELEADASASFKEAMEKKARTVEEKEKGEQTRKEEQATHEEIVTKPLTEEWQANQPINLGSVFDMEKAAYMRKTAPDQKVETPLIQTASASSFSGSSQTPFSPKDEQFVDSLPEAPVQFVEKTATGKPSEVKEVAAPPPISLAQIKESPPLQEIGSIEKPKVAAKPSSSGAFEQKGEGAPHQETPTPPEEIKASGKSFPVKEPMQVEKKRTESPSSTPSFPTKKNVRPSKPASVGTYTPFAGLEMPKTEAPVRKSIEKPTTEPIKLPPKVENKEVQPPALETPIPEKKPESEDLIQKASAITTPVFVGSVPMDVKKKEETPFSKRNEELAEGLIQIEAPSSSDSSEQEKHEDEENEEALKAGRSLLDTLHPEAAASSYIAGDTAPSFSQVLTGFDRLHPEVFNMIDRLVGVITVLQTQGKTETTFILNPEQFPSLQDTEIKITCYDTALSSYKIELSGNPNAEKILRSNVSQLQNSLNDPKKGYKFTVSDITVSLKDYKKRER